MITANPFKAGIPPGSMGQAVDAESRIRLVREFSIEQCNLALRVPGVQRTVALACYRRIRAIKRAVAK